MTTHDPTDSHLIDILRQTRTVAVLGAHDDTERPAGFVPAYLHGQGYRIVPVNPRLTGKELLGQTVVADLRELAEPVDVVDVFRRSEALDGHLEEILGMPSQPRVVWLQKGIRNDSFAAKLAAAGIEVIQDRCIKLEHQRLLGDAE